MELPDFWNDHGKYPLFFFLFFPQMGREKENGVKAVDYLHRQNEIPHLLIPFSADETTRNR